MSFNNELEGFAQAFSQSYAQAESPEDRRYKQARTTLLESQTTPEALDLARRGAEADIGNKEAVTSSLTYENSPEQRKAKEAAAEVARLKTEADLAISNLALDPANVKLQQDATKADTELKQAQAAGKTLENKSAQIDYDLHAQTLKSISNRNPGSKPLEFTAHAVSEGTTGGMSVTAEPGADGPGGLGLTRGAAPADNKAVGDTISSVFGGGGEAAPAENTADFPFGMFDTAGQRKSVGGLKQVEDDSRANPRQQVIDNAINGGGSVLPGGKRSASVAAREATKDGLNSLMQHHGLHDDQAVGTPESDDQQRGYLTGERAGDTDVVDMVKETVNEQAGGDLSENEQTYYSLGTGWLYYNAIGEPEKAKAYAESMLAHSQKVFSQYDAIKQAAVSAGDLDGAAEVAVRAYANLPTGDILSITKTKDGKHYQIMFKDFDGKVLEKSLVTPDEMAAFALQVSPSSSVELIAAAAGREDKTMSDAAAKLYSEQTGIPPEEATKLTTAEGALLQKGIADKAGGGLKVSPISAPDVDIAAEAIGTALDALMKDGKDKGIANIFLGKDGDINKDATDNLLPVATSIYANNTAKVVSAQQAIKAVKHLVENGLPEDMEEFDDNNWIVSVPGQRRLKLDKGQADILIAMHDEMMGQDKLNASNAKEQTEQDAKDAARQKAINDRIKQKAFGPGGELERTDYGIGPGIISDDPGAVPMQ